MKFKKVAQLGHNKKAPIPYQGMGAFMSCQAFIL